MTEIRSCYKVAHAIREALVNDDLFPQGWTFTPREILKVLLEKRIVTPLEVSSHSINSAIKPLVEDGRWTASGRGKGTRYQRLVKMAPIPVPAEDPTHEPVSEPSQLCQIEARLDGIEAQMGRLERMMKTILSDLKLEIPA